MAADDLVCADNDDAVVSQWVYDGGVLLLIIVSIQCFWGLARVCEHYFCASLRVMCEVYNIPDDVAGATLMAIGSSAADLMISVISLFVFNSTIGLGTIIGSEIFNHLVISAACAMSTENSLKLDAKVFSREVVGYGVTLLLMMWALRHGTFAERRFGECLNVEWYHGFVLLVFYVVYVYVTIYFKQIWNKYISRILTAFGATTVIEEDSGVEDGGVERMEGGGGHALEMNAVSKNTDGDNSSAVAENPLFKAAKESASTTGTARSRMPDDKDTPVLGSSSSGAAAAAPAAQSVHSKDAPATSAVTLKDTSSTAHAVLQSTPRTIVYDTHELAHELETAAAAEGAEQTSGDIARRRIELMLHYITLPFHYAICYTIPDVTQEAWREYYWVTAVMSMVWMGALAELLLLCIGILGAMLGISPTLMGITISACGASMPTLWSSVVVARKGLGDMAVSHALGSNVFSVLVGLGLPWFAYPLYINGTYYVQDDGIIPLILLLLLSLIVYYLMVRLNDYYLHFWMGWVFLAMYLVIILLCIFVFFADS